MPQRCGLFGKLPARGDFIAIDVPRDFLDRWEPWLQAGLAASQATLGPSWLNTYLIAPIWRFALDASVGGRCAVGALMPSTDSAGRCFPLTLVACAEADASVHADEGWYGRAEDVLLGTLKPGAGLSFTGDALADLPWPATLSQAHTPDTGGSAWSTTGGPDRLGWSFRCRGLPAAETMAILLSGRPFEDAKTVRGDGR